MVMSGIVDFHSHILPGVDDGSACLEESIAMLRMEAEQGIRYVVATPHFYAQHDSIEDFLERRAEAELRLREEMAKYENLPGLAVGAEVYYFRGISQSDVLQKLTIGHNPFCMIEMPMATWTDTMYRELERIYRDQGIRPIVAHVDRYFSRFRTFGIPEKLEELPVLVQANASFFNGSSSSRAMKMLRKRQIHLLGSDCHNTHSRQPNLGKAVERIKKHAGMEMLEYIVEYQHDVLGIHRMKNCESWCVSKNLAEDDAN